MRLVHLVSFPLAATLLFATACTSDDPATLEPTVTATSEVTPSTTPTGTPTAIPTPPIPNEASPAPPAGGPFRTHIVDVSTGSVATLYVGNQRYLLHDRFYPTFTPDGSAVWLSIRGWDSAKRFALDGTVTDEIEGAWGVIESADARSRAYYLFDQGEVDTAIAVERDGVATRIGGRHALPAFSPDSDWLAVYHIGENNSADLVILDLDTGEQRILATDVDPCPCDLTPGPDWSPSSSYLAYYDFAGNEGDSGLDHATFLVNIATGDRQQLANYAPAFDSPGWLREDFPDRLIVTHRETISLFHGAGATHQVIFEDLNEQSTEAWVVSGRYVQVLSRIRTDAGVTHLTTVVDGLTSERLARWEFQGVASMTPAGPSLVVDSYGARDAGCEGVLLLHPTLVEPECFEGVTGMAWSPDGSTLALSRYADGWLAIQLWQPETSLIELATLPGLNRQIKWNPQGTHLLVTSGSGL